ncbi:MAG: GHKL domain-containing protein [Anaerocolumna sp.]
MQKRKKMTEIRDYGVIAVFILMIGIFACFYFSAYLKPDSEKKITDISNGWQYRSESGSLTGYMKALQHIDIKKGEKLYLFRKLTENLPEAVLMFRTNHQEARLFLEGKLIFESPAAEDGTNPGMGLYFIPLPKGYTDKTLSIELVSPYTEYAGAPESIFLGDLLSLQIYGISRSILHIILMILCITAGIFTMVLSVLKHKYGTVHWGDFAFGMFSILWGFYFPSSDFIIYEFFSPSWVSLISIGLYFLYPLPLFIYFYYQLSTFRKVFLPVIVLRSVFVMAAYCLQMLHIVDFPELLNINNLLYILSAVYLIFLAGVEMKKGNRFIRFTILWIILAFIISVHSLILFYTTRIKQDETLYEMSFFLFIMMVWLYNLREFFRKQAQEKNDLKLLQFKSKLNTEYYEGVKKHMEEVSLMRHEINNHVAALNILMDNGEYKRAETYLAKLTVQNEQITQVVYCDNHLINAILNTRLSEVIKNGIKVTCSIQVPPVLSIGEEELCSLLMNILDNALEAVMDMKADRWIDLKMHVHSPYFYIQCQNSTNHAVIKQDGEIVTTKADKEKHGYGLHIIGQIVKQNDGMFNVSSSPDTFLIEIAIKNTEA